MGKIKVKLTISVNKFVILILFLFALDLFDLSGMLIVLSALIFLVFNAPRIKIDANAVILLLFSFFYFSSVLIFEGASVDSVIKFLILPWACYVLGYNLDLREEGMSVTRLIVILAIGFFIHGFLNFLVSAQIYGIDLNSNFRHAYDFWQQRQISVTTAALYYSPLSVLAIGFVCFVKKPAYKIISLIIIAVTLYMSLIYQNRTLFVVSLIVLITDLIMVVHFSNLSSNGKVKTFLLIIAVALLLLIIWVLDIGGLRTIFEESRLFSRFREAQDRTTIWGSFLFGDAWKYPFGGNQAVLYRNKEYVHNLWLDTFRRAGVIPFLLLTFFTVRGGISVAKMKRDIPGESKNLIVTFFLGMVLIFFFEPILEANPYIFYYPILIMGAICRINRDEEYRLNSESFR